MNFLCVNEVCVSPRIWNWDAISFVLPQDIKLSIAAVPINPISSNRDSSVWKDSINGEFKLQSAYSLAKQLLHRNDTPILSSTDFGWIWKTHSHVRKKFFLWKLLHNGLPVNDVIVPKGIGFSDLCPLCGCGKETLQHLLFDCEMACLVWKEISNHTTLTAHGDFLGWVKINSSSKVLNSLNIEHGTLVIYTLWNLWCYRNQKVFLYAPFNFKAVVDAAINNASEWHFLAGACNIVRVSKQINVHWNPPDPNWFKLNIDGSCSNCLDGVGYIAAGGIIRDYNGSWVKGFASFLGKGTSLLAEIWAVYLGLMVAKSLGCINLVVESDSSIVVDLLCKDVDYTSHHYSALLELCRSDLTSFPQFKVNHVFREGNRVADKIAQFAGQNSSDFCILETLPDFLAVDVLADSVGVAVPRSVGKGIG